MGRYKHFTKYDRIRIESWLRAGMSVKFIAAELHKNPCSVYRELKRGAYEHTLYDLTTETRYSSDLADSRYRENLKEKGSGLKIGSDLTYCHYLEYMIHDRKYSPAAALAYADVNELEFNTRISKTTLYRYIDQGLFLTLSNKDLYIKKNKNRRKHKRVHACSAPVGMSIEQRPPVVSARSSFGHWEMDCVVGRRSSKIMHTFFIIKFFLRSGVLHTHEQSVVYRYSTQARKFICKYLSLIISPSAVSGFMKWDRNYNFRFPQPEIPFIRLQRTLCVKTGIFTPVIIFKRIH